MLQQDSGLSGSVSHWLVQNGPSSLFPAAAISGIGGCLITNIMSNIAAANIFLPALACVAPFHHKPPIVVLAPVTLCISLAFLFPISTPPNAIVLTNKNVSLGQMFRMGLLCTAVFLCTSLLYCEYVIPRIYNMNHVSQEVLDECNVH